MMTTEYAYRWLTQPGVKACLGFGKDKTTAEAINVAVDNLAPKTTTKYAVISYWVGEYETPKTWIYDTYEDATAALKKLYQQSYDDAKNDAGFAEDECFIDETSGKVAWTDLARWFELSPIMSNEEI